MYVTGKCKMQFFARKVKSKKVSRSKKGSKRAFLQAVRQSDKKIGGWADRQTNSKTAGRKTILPVNIY